MSHDEGKGASKQIKGELQEAAGALTDNRQTQTKTKHDKTEDKTE